MEASSPHFRPNTSGREVPITPGWLPSIMEEGTADRSVTHQSPTPKIQKVPCKLSQVDSNQKCYVPSVVSIGPYHHGKQDLASVETLKPQIARDFVLHCKAPLPELSNKFADAARLARNCYAEGSTNAFDDEAFAKMMFLDGCFILHFVDCIMHDDKRSYMKMKRAGLAYAQRDLFLLENQLPFIILETLMSFMTFKEEDGGIKMIHRFVGQTRALPPPEHRSLLANPFRRKSPVHKITSFTPIGSGNRMPPDVESGEGKKQEDRRIIHLLDLLHRQLIEKNALPPICKLTPTSDWYSYRSVTELKATGIHFRASETSRFTDVKYEPGFVCGILRLPPMTIDDSTKSILLNLVAYEMCPDTPDDSAITSYICFMDSLIDHAEDVRELRSKGILLNFLGSDQQVADLFNEIGNDLVPNPLLYDSVKGLIEKHYRNRCKIWITEWLHTHFRTPWAFLAFLAAVCAIALTVVQTYYAANPPPDQPNPPNKH